MQVIKLDRTNRSHQCPLGITPRTDLPKRLCETSFSNEGSSPTTFDVYGIKYSQICGKIIDVRTVVRMHLVKDSHNRLMIIKLKESVSLMAEIHASTSGSLQQLYMNMWCSYIQHSSVLALTEMSLLLLHHHLALFVPFSSRLCGYSNRSDRNLHSVT